MHEKKRGEHEGFMTVREVADLVRVDPQTVYKWIRQGKLDADRIERMRRIRIGEYYRFIGEEPRHPSNGEA